MQTMEDSSTHIGNADNLNLVEFENFCMAVKAINLFWQLVELPEVS